MTKQCVHRVYCEPKFFFIVQIFGFYEEFLSSRFPFSNYKMVFVDEVYQDAASYSTLGIFRLEKYCVYVCFVCVCDCANHLYTFSYIW